MYIRIGMMAIVIQDSINVDTPQIQYLALQSFNMIEKGAKIYYLTQWRASNTVLE